MIVKSQAKVNLFLYVTGKREDGYHTLFTLMTGISLYDRIEFDYSSDKIHVSSSNPEIPDGKGNIAYTAAKLFFDETGIDRGVSIHIDKKIPAGAGLGGGSSNAASVLKNLNNHYNKPLTDDKLAEIALVTGADVPFFLFDGPAVASGVGEALEPWILKRYHLVLIYPGFEVSTATIFKNLNLTLTKCSKKIKELLLWERKRNNPFDAGRHLWNDLEKVTIDLYPEVNAAKNALIESGAESVLMTGSGSTVFGLFEDHLSAEKGFEYIQKIDPVTHRKWQIFQTEFE